MNEFTSILIIAGAIVAVVIAAKVAASFRKTVVVWDYQTALLFKDGRHIKALGPGKHTIWGRGYTVVPFDAHRKELVVQGQEIITADKATLKATAVATYRIRDARRFLTVAQDAVQAVYTAVQLALRQVIGAEEIDKILENKAGYGEKLLELVRETATEVGIEVESVKVRDLILGGDLKKVYAGVLESRKEALALIEKARGEAAALRTLANATRLFENHPQLFQLRYLKALEEAGTSGYGNTIVLGAPEEWVKPNKTNSSG